MYKSAFTSILLPLRTRGLIVKLDGIIQDNFFVSINQILPDATCSCAMKLKIEFISKGLFRLQKENIISVRGDHLLNRMIMIGYLIIYELRIKIMS